MYTHAELVSYMRTMGWLLECTVYTAHHAQFILHTHLTWLRRSLPPKKKHSVCGGGGAPYVEGGGVRMTHPCFISSRGQVVPAVRGGGAAGHGGGAPRQLSAWAVGSRRPFGARGSRRLRPDAAALHRLALRPILRRIVAPRGARGRHGQGCPRSAGSVSSDSV
jgi:hypothetical protein